MANAKIDIVSPNEIPVIAGLYSQMYRPTKDAEFFRRRFLGRYNPLMILASMDENPVGFYLGFELKPSTFYAWLYGVVPECRRMGIASQMTDAAHDWIREREYDWVRFECQNQHRPMLHMALSRGYDVAGVRWDPDREQNLVIFEKSLGA